MKDGNKGCDEGGYEFGFIGGCKGGGEGCCEGGSW